GIAQATDYYTSLPNTFKGQAIDSSSVLIRYTASGDANLDGLVDLTDFTILAANFNGSGKRSALGDFNYSGNVDLTDFTMLAANFNFAVPDGAGAAATLGSTVPEPAALGATGVARALLRRRRRERTAILQQSQPSKTRCRH